MQISKVKPFEIALLLNIATAYIQAIIIVPCKWIAPLRISQNRACIKRDAEVEEEK